jgi:hypothetical protein
MERPSSQKKLADLNANELVATLKKVAIQILSGEQAGLNVFRSAVMYSSNNVKDALKGRSTNRALIDQMPDALAKLSSRNKGYADALHSRYLDKVIPKSTQDQDRLKNAHKAITEIVNALCISSTQRDSSDNLRAKDGPGSRNGKFPQDAELDAPAPARRSKGTHSDPTAAQALAIIANPELREELYAEEPITEYTKGPLFRRWAC